MQMKASFKSRTENHSVSGVISPRIVYGFGTIGWRSITASFIIIRSWTRLYSPKLFHTGRIRVLQGDEQGFNKPCLRNLSMRGCKLVFASGFNGYCH